MTTVAIMQPYFLPYAGYFRLCMAADTFVVLDDVQFQRRGWVHRNRLRNREGELSWLTLPLVKGDRDTTHITDLKFREDAAADMEQQMRRFPIFDASDAFARQNDLAMNILPGSTDVTEYLCVQLAQACKILQIDVQWARSSQMPLDSTLRGWQRLAAIAKHMGADTYINAPGGKAIYDPSDFMREGLQLRFLAPYDGKMDSIFQRLHDDAPLAIRSEIERNIRFDDDV